MNQIEMFLIVTFSNVFCSLKNTVELFFRVYKLYNMRKGLLLFSMACLVTVAGKSQLVIDNATFFIGSGATVTVQGNVTSNVDIQGTGLLQLKGSTLQNVDMGGFTIPNLELDNAAHATLLNTNVRIGSSLTLTNGRLRLGNQNLSIASGITSVTGVSSSRFI